MSKQPTAPRSIHSCLEDTNFKHWKARLWNQYNKNANMLLLSESVVKESLPEDKKVYPSIIAVQLKACDTKTRKSVSCTIAVTHGVIVNWKMAKQTCVAAHSTYAEIRAFYTAI